MRPYPRRAVLVVFVTAVVLSGPAAVPGIVTTTGFGPSPVGTVVADHSNESGLRSNGAYTTRVGTIENFGKNPEDRRPNEAQATYQQFTNIDHITSAVDVNYTVLYAPVFDNCSPANLRAFGVDRASNGDQRGTHTDDTMLQYYKNDYTVNDVKFNGMLSSNGDVPVQMQVVNWKEKGDDNPFIAYPHDQFVVEQADCKINPEEAGWYRIFQYSNATKLSTGEYGFAHGYSKWFYVCECENRAEAVEKLGEPPSDGNNQDRPAPRTVDAGGEFTVQGVSAADHHSDASDTSWTVSVTPDLRESLTLEEIRVTRPGDVGDCLSNVSTLGIDRGGTKSGAGSDVDVADHTEQSRVADHSIDINLVDPDDPYPRDPLTLDRGDEYVHKGTACVNTPSDGWYRANATVVGTESDGTRVKYELTSEYYYVCDCDSRREAVETLGRPPSDGDSDPAPTPTPDGTVTRSPVRSDTPTPTANRGPTPTLTVTRDSTATLTATGTATADATRSATGTQGDQHLTPTSSDGPGFGPLVALGGLLAAALLALRRDP